MLGSVWYGTVRFGSVRFDTGRYGDAGGINSIEILYSKYIVLDTNVFLLRPRSVCITFALA